MAKVIDTERRLVAIFAVTALIQRRAILDGLISSHRGRIANIAGDGVLAEFGAAGRCCSMRGRGQAALCRCQLGHANSPSHQLSHRLAGLSE
jgi:class 3 adenylate cyclase